MGGQGTSSSLFMKNSVLFLGIHFRFPHLMIVIEYNL